MAKSAAKEINKAKAISKGIVLMGYSAGGTFMLDMATMLDEGPGSIIALATVSFDNSPSYTTKKSFGGTRMRHIAGTNDIFFPPDNTNKRIDVVRKNFGTSKKGSWPDKYWASHSILPDE